MRDRWRSTFISTVRISVGIGIVAIPAYYLAAPSPPVRLLYAIFVLSIIGGLIMGTWWSTGLVTGAVALGFGLWQRIECADCPPRTEPPTEISIILMAIVALIPISGAAIGSALWKLLARIAPWLRGRLRGDLGSARSAGGNTTSSR